MSFSKDDDKVRFVTGLPINLRKINGCVQCFERLSNAQCLLSSISKVCSDTDKNEIGFLKCLCILTVQYQTINCVTNFQSFFTFDVH